MNSSLASPTPLLGICPCWNAFSGTPTFIIICVLVSGRLSRWVSSTLYFNKPSYILPTPSEQSIVMCDPLWILDVPSPVPITQGMPSSLEIIAA